MRSAMSYPRTATRFGSIRVTAVFHTASLSAAFNGIFMIARTPGLVAHVLEEQTREKPMRRIDPVKHGYDGPAPRGLAKE
jgi:citrate synthase